MRVLMVHKFFYIEGGAERYVFNLTDLLQKNGDVVIPFAMHHPKNFESEYSKYFVSYFNPDQLRNRKGLVDMAKNVYRVVYNKEAQKKLEQLIQAGRPDIAHVHSVYHHLSPSVLSTLKKYNLPVVLTLHDYKLVCPNYIFLDGSRRICEACKGRHFWKATVKKCFRDSFAASLLVSLEATVHKYLRSYKDNVDLFISPSAFLGARIAGYGYGQERVLIQPYSLDLNAYKPHFGPSNYFVFMGRLTHEKGVHFLLTAMKQVNGAELYLLGTGPLDDVLQQRILHEKISNVKMSGYKSGEELKAIISHALFTVVTSEWHDNSPLVIYESKALGNAVIGARMGGIPELIENGVDGYIYDPGDMKGFVARVNQLIANPKLAVAMGKNARKNAEQMFAPGEHYQKIKEIYQLTISRSNSKLKMT